MRKEYIYLKSHSKVNQQIEFLSLDYFVRNWFFDKIDLQLFCSQTIESGTSGKRIKFCTHSKNTKIDQQEREIYINLP